MSAVLVLPPVGKAFGLLVCLPLTMTRRPVVADGSPRLEVGHFLIVPERHHENRGRGGRQRPSLPEYLRSRLPISVAPGGAWTYCEHGPMAPAMGYSLALLRSFAPSIINVLANVKNR
ncbi:MAG: hypothetical protein EXS36_16285 [Pedosphaera sp.]|nr:hypothetical protein [Pedosphaera sp.]